jgi:fumagillin biosynthesis dioxygenase
MDLEAKKRELLDEGCCVLPGVLTAAETERVRERLWAAAEQSERLGVPTRQIGLDPNEHNIRVFYLLERDAIFRDLIQHPMAIEFVTALLTSDFLISNFTANIALPGSKSMELHSDQGIVVPEPWFHPWSINVIWCLDDVDEENGATRYVPGSHKIRWTSELPADARERTVPFKASAGSIAVMDGRLWHTSGANVSRSRERALLFGYYSRSFIRQQQNWNASLSPGTIDGPTSGWRSGCGFIPSPTRRTPRNRQPGEHDRCGQAPADSPLHCWHIFLSRCLSAPRPSSTAIRSS